MVNPWFRIGLQRMCGRFVNTGYPKTSRISHATPKSIGVSVIKCDSKISMNRYLLLCEGQDHWCQEMLFVPRHILLDSSCRPPLSIHDLELSYYNRFRENMLHSIRKRKKLSCIYFRGLNCIIKTFSRIPVSIHTKQQTQLLPPLLHMTKDKTRSSSLDASSQESDL